MIRAFATAATGMDAQQMMVDSIANNLANVNTTGFKRSMMNFQDLLYLKMREADREVASGIKAPSGLEIGSGVQPSATTKVFSMGELQRTDNELDMAIQGDGFLEVTLPGSGEKRYTRDGSLQKDANGKIVTASGYPISPAITIPADAISVDIAGDGTVNAQTPTGNQVLGNLQLYRFQNSAGLSSEGGNLYRETEASGTATAGTPGQQGYGSILSKYVEKSNVQMVSELVNLITAQRGYEINSKVIRAGDNMLTQLGTLLR
jgi:flagellar basal-body rod protein FlgG